MEEAKECSAKKPTRVVAIGSYMRKQSINQTQSTLRARERYVNDTTSDFGSACFRRCEGRETHPTLARSTMRDINGKESPFYFDPPSSISPPLFSHTPYPLIIMMLAGSLFSSNYLKSLVSFSWFFFFRHRYIITKHRC